MIERRDTTGDIAIIGMAARFPDADDYHEFWQNLKHGKCSIRQIPNNRWDVSRFYTDPAFDEHTGKEHKSISQWCGLLDGVDLFDAEFFAISARQSHQMDPQQRLLLQESKRCIDDAGIALAKLQHHRTGVYIGVMAVDYLIESTQGQSDIDSYACLGNFECILANRISHFFALQGPSFSIDAACASSLVAIAQASAALLAGDIEYALAGGVSLNLHPWKYISFSKARMLSPEGLCKTFAADANGYVPGEGVGVLLLQRLAKAQQQRHHIHGVILASAVHHGGRTNSITAPSIESQQGLISRVIARADINPESIGYVEAHGTGTPLGDPIEVSALHRAFKQYTNKRQFCYLGALKSNIGHLEAAAGVAGVIKVVLMMRHGYIPPTLHIKQVNPILPLQESAFRLAHKGQAWQHDSEQSRRRAGVSSFGFGGTISHLIVESGILSGRLFTAKSNVAVKSYPFVLSAKSQAALERQIAKWRQWCHGVNHSASEQNYSIADMCKTVLQGREHYDYRWGCQVRSFEQLTACLDGQIEILANLDPQWALACSGAFGSGSGSGFSYSGYRDVRLMLKHAGVFGRVWKQLKPQFVEQAWFEFFAQQFKQPKWQASYLKANAFLAQYIYLKGVIALSGAPLVITSDKDGVWLGLALSGIVSVTDVVAYMLDEKPLNEIALQKPKIAFYDPCQGQLLSSSLFTADYFSSLIDNADVSVIDIEAFLTEMQLLQQSHYTFNSMLKQWLTPLREHDLSFDDLMDASAKHFQGLGRQRQLIKVIVFQCCKLKLYRKWHLSSPKGLLGQYLDELTRLIDALSLAPSLITDMVFAKKHGFEQAAIQANRRFTFVRQIEALEWLQHHNEQWPVFDDFSSWLKEAQQVSTIANVPDIDCWLTFGEMQFDGQRQRLFSVDCACEFTDVLLRLYQVGLDIDWQAYFNHKPYQSVPMPTYEFVGQSYWINNKNNEAAFAMKSVPTSTLNQDDSDIQGDNVDKTAQMNSQSKATQFQRRIGYQQDAVIADTVIGLPDGIKRCITPSPLRIELALTATSQKHQGLVNSLSDVRFPNPGIIDDDVIMVVKIDDAGRFELTKQPCDGSSADHIELLATGVISSLERCQALAAKKFTDEINPSALEQKVEQKIEQKVEHDDIYAAFAQWGYQYGPGMRLITEITQTPSDIFVYIQSKPTAEGALSGLDPFALDAMFQGVFYAAHLLQGLFDGDCLYVPIHINQISLFQALSGAMVVVLDKATFRITANGDIETSFYAYDSDFNALLYVDTIYFRRVARTFLLPQSDVMDTSAMDTSAIIDPCINYLKDIFAQQLECSVQHIAIKRKLEEIGVDSLLNQEIVNRLALDFPDLPMTLLFEYTTIADVAQYLVDNHTDVVCQLLKIDLERRADTTHATLENPPAQGAADEAADVTAGVTADVTGMRDGRQSNDDSDKEIAIIGCSGRFPQANNIDQFWQNLKAGRHCITKVPPQRWDADAYFSEHGEKGKSYTLWGGFVEGADEFDPLFFNITPKQAQLMDPQQRIFLQTAWASLEDAGLTRSNSPDNTGVFVGVTTNTYGLWAAQSSVPEYAVCPDTDNYDIANRVSYFCNFHGPSMSIDTACSSSLSCVHVAVQSLLQGECDMAIAGGVSLTLHPNRIVQFCQKNMLSQTDYCHPFGQGDGGFVDAEGAVAVVLMPMSAAVKHNAHIYGIVKGSAINTGGQSSGYTVPNPKTQANLVIKALEKAQISPRQVSYIEAHGTGTTLGDPIEIEGLTQAFSQYTQDKQFCAIGSVKSNIGHLIAAAGISGLVKILLQMKHKSLVPSIHSTPSNPHIDFAKTPFYVQQSLSEWHSDGPRIAGVSSFGVGGANAHVIVQEPLLESPVLENQAKQQKVNASSADSQSQLIIVCAKSHDRLRAYAKQLGQFAREHSDNLNVQNFAYTLQTGRESMAHKLAFVAQSVSDLIAGFEQALSEQHDSEKPEVYFSQAADEQDSSVATLFAGVGSEDFVKTLFLSGQWHRLAKLWIAGVDVQWDALYSDLSGVGTVRTVPLQKLSLPTYPFAKTRFWLPQPPQSQLSEVKQLSEVNRESNPAIHPLIDSVDCMACFAMSQSHPSQPHPRLTFVKTFHAQHWVLCEHKVQHQGVLPGVAGLEMVLAAAKQVTDKTLKFSHVKWHHPIAIDNALAACVKVSVVLTHRHPVIEFTVQTASGNSNADNITHLSGALHQADKLHLSTVSLASFSSLAQIKETCSSDVSNEQIYQRFAECGIDYGRSFRGIVKWQYHRDHQNSQALGVIELPEHLTAEFENYHLHPAMLDACLQTALLLVAEKNNTMVPFSVAEVTIFKPLPAKVFAYVQANSDNTLDITVFNDTGEVCLQLKQMLFLAAKSPFDAFFYTPYWQRQEPKLTPLDMIGNKSKVLVILPPHPLDAQAMGLATQLTDIYGQALVTVAVDQLDLSAYQSIEQIYFLAGLVQLDETNGAKPQQGALATRAQLSLVQSEGRYGNGCLALHQLVKDLSANGYADQNLQLTIVTALCGLCGEINSEPLFSPWEAGLCGMAKTITLEFPDWYVVSVAINPRQNVADLLVREPATSVCEQVALVDGHRYVRHMKMTDIKPSVKGPFRRHGVYVIVGGLGGIGLTLAHHLASSVQANIVIWSRKPQEQVDSALIAQIEQHGVKVQYLPTDITCLDAVQASIAETKSQFGQIHGVFNCAIVLHDGALESLSAQQFKTVYDTKVSGSFNLGYAFADEALDFMTFFSSVLSVTGNAGQGNYVAGGTFQDAMAHYLNQVCDYPVYTINWGYWGSVGIVATEEFSRRLDRLGMQSISPQQGMQALERMLSQDVCQVVAVKANKKLQDKLMASSADTKAQPMDDDRSLNDALHQLNALCNQISDELYAFNEGYAKLSQLSVQWLFNRFESLALLQPDSPQVRAMPKSFARFYQAALTLIANAGFDSDSPNTSAQFAQQQTELEAQYPKLGAYLKLLTHCIEHYEQVLGGKMHPTQVMFPNSSMDLVSGVYKDNPVSDYFNSLVAQSAGHFVKQRCGRLKAAEKIKILEIGAGTGGTSGKVLQALADYAEHIEYVYTDISSFFLQHGRKAFGQQFGFVSYQLLDIAKDLEGQSVNKNDYDLILATNVLHATADINRTLTHIDFLLKDNGWLLLNEMTKAQNVLTLTFGLLDGWWLFEDEPLRIKDSPLLTEKQWQSLLAQHGFGTIGALAPDDEQLNLSQTVFVAQKHRQSDGQAENPVPKVHQPSAASLMVSDVSVNSKSMAASVDDSSLEQVIADEVIACIEQVSGIAAQEIDEQQAFTDYGIDSIVGIELIKAINDAFDIKLSKTALFDHTNVVALVEYIEASYGEQIGQGLVSAGQHSVAAPVAVSTASDDIDEDDLSQLLTDLVLENIEQITGIDSDLIDQQQPFSQYGIDSISGIELIQQLGQSLDVVLSKTALFDHNCVTALTDFMVQKFEPQVLAYFQLSQKAASSAFTEPLSAATTDFAPASSRQSERHWGEGIDSEQYQQLLHCGFNRQGNWHQDREVTQDYLIDVKRNNCIRDHVIYGQYIMPSDAYLEMLYIGCKTLADFNGALKVDGFDIQFPMITSLHEPLDARLTLSRTGRYQNFAIDSKVACQSGGYQRNVSGQFSEIEPRDVTNQQHKAIWQQYSTKVEPRQIYTPEAILKVGPSYQTISEIRHDEQFAVSLLRHSPKGQEYCQQFVLAPSIVDGLFATGLYFASYLSGDVSNFFIPVLFETIEVHQTLVHDSYYGLVKVVSVKPEHIVFDLALIDESDRQVMSFSGFHLQKIKAEDLQKYAPQVPASQQAVEHPTSTAKVSSRPTNAQASTDKGMNIAIIGMAGRFPMATDVEGFWQNLRQGKDCIIEVPDDRWCLDDFYDSDPKARNKTYSKWGGFLSDIDCFDSLFFQISGQESELCDPEHRVFLEDCWKTFEDAGYCDVSLDGLKVGVFVGAAKGDYQVKMHHEQGAVIEGPSFPGNETSVLAARISYFLNLKGPAIAVNTACSSSLVVINLACQSMLAGEIDMALAGGVHICTTPLFYILTSKCNMLSPVGQCRAFDNGAEGFVPGEASAAILLKPLASAIYDGDHVYGVIRGIGVNQDGKTNGMTAPSSVSQSQLQLEVYQRYGIDAGSINYIETHGTGTKLGDPIEIEALSHSFRQYTDERQFCPIGSVKTNVGHTARAAGITSVIKVLLSLKHQQLLPSLHCDKPNEYIDFEQSPFYVNRKLTEWKTKPGHCRRAAISSYGISGTNCHLVIDEAPAKAAPNRQYKGFYLIAISAKTEQAFKQKVADLALWLSDEGQQHHIADIAYTLQVGRSHFAQRLAWVVTSIEELMDKLNDPQLRPLKHKADRAIRKQGKQFVANINQVQAQGPSYAELLQQLAELYHQGYTPNWTALYQDGEFRRIPMPVYPFEKHKFWIPQSADPSLPLYDLKSTQATSTQTAQRDTRLPPLLDAIVIKQSVAQGLCFEKCFSPNDWYVEQHVVNGKCMLPGVIYLEMAYSGFALSQSKPFELINVNWLKPLVIDTIQQVNLLITAKFDESGHFQQSGHEFSINHPQSDSYCRGEFQLSTAQQPNDIAIEPLLQAPQYRLSSADIYQQLAQINVKHQGRFKVLEQLLISADEALGVLDTSSKLSTSAHEMTLAPELLDACLQVGAVFIVNQLDGDNSYQQLLPASLGKLQYFGVKAAPCYVHLKQCGPTSVKLSLLDSQGRVAMLLDQVHYQGKTNTLSDFFYQPFWRPLSLADGADANGSGSLNHSPVLFIVNQLAPTQALLAHLRRLYADHNVWIVSLQTGQTEQQTGQIAAQHWSVNYCDPQALYQTLSKGNFPCPETIYFMGALQAMPSPVIADEPFTRAQQMGVMTLFRLIKALHQLKWTHRDISLCLLTANAHRVFQDELSNPYLGGMFGLAKTAVKEFLNLKLSCIDVDLADASEDLARFISSQPYLPNPKEMALRHEKAYVLSIKPLDMPHNNLSGFRRQGVYLIVGGAGGIGFEFSCYLARQVQAKLIWLGRRTKNAEIEQKLNHIQNLGGQGIYLEANLANLPSLQAAIAKAQDEYGDIHGVVHSALVLEDKSLANMDESTFVAPFAAKVHGTVNLYQAIAPLDLDFLMFFSSGESFTCYPGQSNYAAACTFKDGFALSLQSYVHYPVKIINWGYWGTVGVVADEVYRQQLQQMGVYSIDPALGMAAIERILMSDQHQVMPIRASKKHLAEIGVEFPEDANVVKNVAQAAGISTNELNTRQSSEFTGQVETNVAHQSRLLMAQDYVKGVLSQVLKIDKHSIDIDESFEVYGLDSLVITSVVSQFEQDLGALPIVVIYEHMNVASLTQYFIEHYQQAIEKVTGFTLSSLSADGKSIAATPVATPVAQTASELAAYEVSAQDVAIVGLCSRYPMACDTAQFWQNIRTAQHCISEIPQSRWDWRLYHGQDKYQLNTIYSHWGGFIDGVDEFDALFFAIAPNEAKLMDPQERLFIEAAWTVIEDAGYTRQAFGQQKVGVYVGVMHSDYDSLAGELWGDDNLTTAHSSFWSIANRISFIFDFQGPSMAVNTACSSALTAIHLAYENIKAGRCQWAIAGGVNLILHPKHYMRLSAATMLSSSAQCKSFGAGADGFVDGEGLGAVLLCAYSQALQDDCHIYGIIKGSAMNSGGKTTGYTVPNLNAQASVIGDALLDANVDASTIGYIEAHGTATALGDPIEVAALTKAYRQFGVSRLQSCAIGSVKSNIGHLESAAGMAGLTKVLLQIKHKTLVPSIHATELNSHIDFAHSPFYLQQQLADWPVIELDGKVYPRRAGLSSFGAGGTNHHMIIEEAPQSQGLPVLMSKTPLLFVLSAKSEQSLRVYAQKFVDFLNTDPCCIGRLAYTLQLGREGLSERLAIVFYSVKQLLEKLLEYLGASLTGPSLLSTHGIYCTKVDSYAPLAHDHLNPEQASRAENINEIAKLWVSGHKVDWQRFNEGNRPQKMALPTYPFAKERHWLTDVGQPVNTTTSEVSWLDEQAAKGKKRVAVIGAGPAGLTTAKCLMDEGHLPFVFEKTDKIGGIWTFRDDHRGGAYQSTRLQTSKFTSLFSDFPPPEHMPVFPGVADLNQYLIDYANQFNVHQRVQFNTQLHSMEQQGQQWLLTFKKADGTQMTHSFDGVSICIGNYWQPKALNYPGLDTFTKEQLHSANYHNGTLFSGKNVLIIGNGVSGMDLAVDACQYANRVMVSQRSKKMIIPRMFGYTASDSSISAVKRLIINQQSLDEIFAEWRQSIPEHIEHLKRNDLLPLQTDLQRGGKENVLLVSDDYVQMVNQGKIDVKGEIARFDQTHCYFQDGAVEPIDIIVNCTGYQDPQFTFFPEPVAIDKLYKYQFHPDYPNVSFMGCKKASLSVIPTIELEARWFAKLMSNEVALPSAEQMRAITKHDRAKENNKGALFPSVDSSLQNIWLAEQIGAFPNPVEDWALYWKLINLPAIPYIYRLIGPNSKPEAQQYLDDMQNKLYINVNDPRIESLKFTMLAKLGRENLEYMVHTGQITTAQKDRALGIERSAHQQNNKRHAGESTC